MNVFSNFLRSLLVLFLFGSTLARISFAACGATTYTWQGADGTTDWNTNANWNPNTGRPNNANENAYIIGDNFLPVWPDNSQLEEEMPYASRDSTKSYADTKA